MTEGEAALWLLAAEGSPASFVADRPPKPFPGKYPTRVAMLATVYKGGVSGAETTRRLYVGKPVGRHIADIARWYTRSFLSKFGIWLGEFDRGGMISVVTGVRGMVAAPMSALRETHLNQKLHTYYHPWDFSGEGATSFCGRWVTKRVLGHQRGRVHVVYAPERVLHERGKLRDSVKNLGDYKEFLRASGIDG